MYAVIKTGGKQYRVAAEDVIEIERTGAAEGDMIEFPALMVGDGDKVDVGTPVVDGATVAGQVTALSRGPKIIVFKKKRRKHYRRKNGHRQDLMQVQITEILTDGKKPSKKAAAPKKEAAPKKDTAKKEAPKKEAAASGALFDAPAGEPDDLKQISGVGPALEKKLHGLGITKYAQVAAFTADDIAKVDDALSFKGRIERDDWVGQAAKLAADDKA